MWNTDYKICEKAWETVPWVKDQKTVYRCFYFTIPVETFHFFPSYSAFLCDKHSLIKCEDKLQFRQPTDKYFRGMLER